MSNSHLEQDMLWQILAADLPEPHREYRFHPKRKWRVDFAWPEQKIIFEAEGGIYKPGEGHASARRFTDDCEKYNEAVILGWSVLRATGAQIRDGSAVAWLRRMFDEK